jgi:hypothetical protein
MTINMSETIHKIKRVGATNVRMIPMPGQNVNTGMYQVEIKEGSNWISVAEGMPKDTAASIIQQATSKVICG